jgi:hypothetical protein
MLINKENIEEIFLKFLILLLFFFNTYVETKINERYMFLRR